MSETLSQDDLNALLGGLACNDTIAPRKEATIVGTDLSGLLSQEDLNALMGISPGSQNTAPREEPTIVDAPVASKGESMSQDEIDDLLRQFDKDV